MIDYQQPLGFPLFGSLSIEPFGIVAALAVLTSVWVAQKRSEQMGYDYDLVRQYSFWYIVVAGFIGAHVFDTIFYRWDDWMKDPLLIIKIHMGISSFGGILGAVIGYFLFVWKHQVPKLRWMDMTAMAFLPGFMLGRLSCTLVMDHASKTGFELSNITDYPFVFEYYRFTSETSATIQKVQVLNLGFYEFLYLAMMLVVLIALYLWRRWPDGFALGYFLVLYAPVRYFMEYLRPESSDPRHLGLTFAQWTAIASLIIGLVIWFYSFKRQRVADYPPRIFLDSGEPAAESAGKKQ